MRDQQIAEAAEQERRDRDDDQTFPPAQDLQQRRDGERILGGERFDLSLGGRSADRCALQHDVRYLRRGVSASSSPRRRREAVDTQRDLYDVARHQRRILVSREALDPAVLLSNQSDFRLAPGAARKLRLDDAGVDELLADRLQARTQVRQLDLRVLDFAGQLKTPVRVGPQPPELQVLLLTFE